ncbi:MAG TPA: UbiA family prenyltransferase [Candidatus Limnocylindria bacterium]|nr:UbiA family prenyltransferase [Candidatus Limnocylindria bacterium]
MASPHPSARTLLVLGRASNLPTVWSNCFAGWVLGGGGSWRVLFQLGLGGTLLYLGGMYLNDAFDASFDRQFRRERPIPSEAIGEPLVWQLGFAQLALGWLLLALLGWDSALLATLLVIAVLVYDAVHKAVAFSPVLMAACRFFLLLVAASAGAEGVTGEGIWNAFGLAGWIVGLSYVAKRESTTGRLQRWPLAPLALPLFFAALYNFHGESQTRALVLALALVGWAAWCLRRTFQTGTRNLGLTVSGLLAGICLVDCLAVAPSWGVCAVFGGLFLASLLGQRFVPAT